MRTYLLLFLATVWCCLYVAPPAKAQSSNAAPSQHLVFSFPADASLKMMKVKITQTAYTSYFSVFNWSGGYAGLQHTPDSSSGSARILIASQWDPNTAGGVLARQAYLGAGTIYSRFGGEGDGAKTINPYNWTLNTWYNFVIRAWKLNGELFIGTFVQNLSTNQWFHTSTLAIPTRATFLGAGSGAFLENWHGSDPRFDGRFVRKAYFKDCWNRTDAGVWQKSSSRYFSCNANDAYRNGIYDLAYNAGFDSGEDAYFMEHGGNVTPSAAFNGGRTLNLPDQTNQPATPTLTIGEVSTVSASYNAGAVTVNWTNNNTKSPQFSSTVEVLNAANTVTGSSTETLPQKRSAVITGTLSAGTYTARVTITDIFGGVSTAKTTTFTVRSGGISGNWYKIKNVHSGKYLGIENSSTANLAYIAQYANGSSNNLQWKLVSLGSNYVLVNRNSSKAIDIANSDQTSGVQLIQYTVTNGLNQQWQLVSAGSGSYLIRTAMSSGNIIDNPGSSTADGTKMILYAANGTTGTPNQRWLLEDQGVAAAQMLSYSKNSTTESTTLMVSPNPASSFVYVNLPAKGKEIRVFNVSGALAKVIKGDLSGKVRVDISSLDAGMYIVQFEGKQVRFIKQ
ncbi:DUF3472 domain-containing protein [Chitinophaga niabensis]|uniref:Por secretion system C-terminal sorting domain-containing protein n=1 Tax=Chitinophaga niabensis TaxID=536979 RepID=A0A1N6F0Q5_9BACT|nr:RICIN domain-containing protein [Chitinophaga niabensis]SIN88797.1 Por secretion system C-terminal sorting domain-containing protein [Chitinophaga niabensis]